MTRILKNLIKYKKYNLMGLISMQFRCKRRAVIPYKNTYLNIDKRAEVRGTGHLSLGIQHESGRYMPSQMIMRGNSTLTLDGRMEIYCGHNIWINENASLILGSGYINNGLNLSCFKRIEIGHDVAISENLTIRDSDDHHLASNEITKPIKIGNKVWIGINVTILKGVTVGDGAVIAAGSLVNHDVPPRSLVAGVPAVVKKQNIDWY